MSVSYIPKSQLTSPWLVGEPPRSAREAKSPHPIVAPNQSPREAKHSGRSAIRGRSLDSKKMWKVGSWKLEQHNLLHMAA